MRFKDRIEEAGEKVSEVAKSGTAQVCVAILCSAIILAIGIMIAAAMVPSR